MNTIRALFYLVTLIILPPFASAQTLYLYNWNNYLSDNTIKEFEAYCHCKLEQSYYGDNEEMLAKLAAGASGYDIVVPTGWAVNSLIKQGKALALDKSKLPNARNLNPQFMNQSFDPGNHYSVPYAYTTTLLGYNATRLHALGLTRFTNSWALIFDPKVLEKLKGRITVLDSPRELTAAALMYLGKPADSTNIADWQAARDVILKAKPYWAAFNNQSYIKELTVGNIYVAFGYSSDMYQAQQDAKKANRPFTLAFNLQTEGNTLSLDNLVILKNAPNKALAYQFINFLLEGKHAATLSNELGIGNPNQAALSFIRPEIVRDPSIIINHTEQARLQQLSDLKIKARRKLNDFWTEIKVR